MVRYLVLWPSAWRWRSRSIPGRRWRSGCSVWSGPRAAALLVRAIVRGLNLSRWIAWLLAAATFAALLAKAVGGLAPLTAALDTLGFTLGSRRFTLLALVQIVIGLLALYAVGALRHPPRRPGDQAAAAGSIRPSSCWPRSSPRSRSSPSPSSSASTSPASISPRSRSSRARSASPSASACRRRSAI